MGKQKITPPGEGQEVFRFEPPREMPRSYQEFVALAEEGTRYRNARRNQLALTSRTAGFRRKVTGFIPRSGTENSAIAANPETKLKNEKHFARERVHEKWEGEGVSPNRIRQWASFAAGEVEAKGRGKYRSWRIDALMQVASLAEAIQENCTVTEDSIKGSEQARGAIDAYLVDLKIFVSKPEGGRRQWIARTHTRRREAEMSWARQYADGLTRDEYERLYVEAFGNAWSRERFWAAAEDEYQARQQELNDTEPVWANPPPGVYNDTPEARGFYEVDLGDIALESYE